MESELTAAQRDVIDLLAKGHTICRAYNCKNWVVWNGGREFRSQTITDIRKYVSYYFDGLQDNLRLTEAGIEFAKSKGWLKDAR